MANVIRFCMELLRFVLVVTRPLSDKILDILYVILMGRTPTLPPITDDILLTSATELAEKIRKRKVKCEAVMKAYIFRMRLVNTYINAYVDERFHEALKDAEEVDRFLESTDKSEEQLARDTPLLGIPFSCKEATGVKGLSQTAGLVAWKNRKAPQDSDTAAAYRRAGAIPVVVTNIPPVCMWWESDNKVYGRTKNPYHVARIPAGSSGGEAALIASAGSLIGIGSDLGGSIRLPAMCCGIYGHKPSRGVISNKGHWPEDNLGDYWYTGPMCRYAQDLKLLVRVLSSNNIGKLRLDEKVDFRRVKIYYMEEFPGLLLSATSHVKAAVRRAAKHFEDEYGVKATKLKFGELRYAFNLWESKALEIGGPSLKEAFGGKNGPMNPYFELLKSLFRCSDITLPIIYFAMAERREKDDFHYKCLKMYEDLTRKFEYALAGSSVLLLPTQPEPPLHHLMTIPKFLDVGYTSIFNLLGYPATQIPAGLSNGLPIGIQAVSLQYNDHLTIAAAEELDKVFRGWISPCPINV